MQLSELRLRLRARIGNPSIADVPDSPNLDQHINDAYDEILNKYKFKRTRKRARFTTVVGQDKYDVSGLTNVIYKAWDRTNGRELEKVGKTILAERDYDASPNNLVTNGRPVQWAHIETYLQLLPPPDGAYVIEFVHKALIAPLINPTDVPIISATWHRAIATLAAAIYYDDEGGDPAKATYNRNAFSTWALDQPVEDHEETEAIDSGVQMPTLRGSTAPRLDFDRSE